MMKKRTNCVYCGNKINTRSKEHVIQNALGGLLESDDICCDKCNTFLSKYIDEPFTRIFNGITSRIKNLTKTNNTKSSPICTGKAIYNDTIYDVNIKNGKIVGCPELCKELKCNVKDIPLEIVAYDFNIDNDSFNNGIKKIAFNFAIAKGIDLDKINVGLNIVKKGEQIKSIDFNYGIVPFVPLNPLDSYIELDTELELYHNLILFSQDDKLWCYVDLFNTFQYYILLSDKWDKDNLVLETYLQLVQKIDKTPRSLYIRKPKHMLTYSMIYGVKTCDDIDEFKRRVQTAIQKESPKKSMSYVISSKIGSDFFRTDLIKGLDVKSAEKVYNEKMKFKFESFLLYFNEDDFLIESTFRQVTIIDNNRTITSYPVFINLLLMNGKLNVKEYTYKKFKRLNDFLINQ